MTQSRCKTEVVTRIFLSNTNTTVSMYICTYCSHNAISVPEPPRKTIRLHQSTRITFIKNVAKPTKFEPRNYFLLYLTPKNVYRFQSKDSARIYIFKHRREIEHNTHTLPLHKISHLCFLAASKNYSTNTHFNLLHQPHN